MCKKKICVKGYRKTNGKRGYTLVELCIVLALIAILSTMVISFSALMSGYARSNKTQYNFLEDCSEVKQSLTEWAYQADSENTVFTINANGRLTVNDSAKQTVDFTDGVLFLGETEIDKLEEIDDITFYTNGNLIKCVMHRTDDNGKEWEHSFVFSIRCGTIETEGATQNE